MKFPSANGYLFVRDMVVFYSKPTEPDRVRQFSQPNLRTPADPQVSKGRKSSATNADADKSADLLPEFQFSSDVRVPIGVLAVEVIQQTPALPDHHEQSTPGAVVFDVLLQVLGQMIDALCQQGDLNIRRPCVAFVSSKFFNCFRLGFHASDVLSSKGGTLFSDGSSVKHFSQTGTRMIRIR